MTGQEITLTARHPGRESPRAGCRVSRPVLPRSAAAVPRAGPRARPRGEDAAELGAALGAGVQAGGGQQPRPSDRLPPQSRNRRSRPADRPAPGSRCRGHVPASAETRAAAQSPRSQRPAVEGSTRIALLGLLPGPSAGSTCHPVPPRTPAAPSGWLLPGAGCRHRDDEHGKRVDTKWVEQSETQPGSITLTVHRAATPRQRHEQSLSPAAPGARHPGTDHRCWPGAARCRASLRPAVQLGDVSGPVRRWEALRCIEWVTQRQAM